MVLETIAEGTVTATEVTGEGSEEITIKVVGLPEHKFSEEEMAAAFELVSPEEHWKAAIFAEIPAEKREVVAEAIAFYTASEAVFAEAGEGKLYVTAIGYWAGPAGG